MMSRMPEYLSDVIGAVYQGEEIRIWNHLTVTKQHEVRANEIETHHRIFAGDGSTAEEPEYVTPDMDDQLRALDVYPDVTVLDPDDDEVTIL